MHATDIVGADGAIKCGVIGTPAPVHALMADLTL